MATKDPDQLEMAQPVPIHSLHVTLRPIAIDGLGSLQVIVECTTLQGRRWSRSLAVDPWVDQVAVLESLAEAFRVWHTATDGSWTEWRDTIDHYVWRCNVEPF